MNTAVNNQQMTQSPQTTNINNPNITSIIPPNNPQNNIVVAIATPSAPPPTSTITLHQPPQLPKPQQPSITITNLNSQTLKRSREESTNTTHSDEVALNICVDANNNNINTNTDMIQPPIKKLKISDTTNTNNNSTMIPMHTVPANSDAFDEQNPYLNTNTNKNNNGYSHSHSFDGNKGKVVTRTQSELKRYLHTMDDDVLKNDLLPKLCESHSRLLESIRQRMNENTILCKIFIRSLSYDTEDKTVYDMFTKFGNVKEAVIVKDRQTGKSRGFGFITMSNAAEAQAALVEHRKMIDGREAICNLASKPQGQKTSTNSKKRDDSSFHSHSHRNSEHSSRSKRSDDSPPNIDRYTVPPAPAHAYGYHAHTAAPYAYDYSYQYPHYAAAVNTTANTAAAPHSAYSAVSAAVNPYSSINPYANPYAQYNRTQATTANANNVAQNAASAAVSNAAVTIGNQPYVPSMAGQNVAANMAAYAAAPYRFN